jgi:hypothetical protein
MSIANTMSAKRVTDEVRHAHDELEYFYLEAKRNKRLAKWAAKKLGIDKHEYFLELIGSDLSKAGPRPVVDRVMQDFLHAGIEIPEEKIWEKIRKYEQEILRSMLEEQAKRIEEEIKTENADIKRNNKKKK